MGIIHGPASSASPIWVEGKTVGDTRSWSIVRAGAEQKMSAEASGDGITHLAGPLVGRRAQLRWLDVCLSDCLAGAPRVVLLRGEPGIGKTRLARAFEARARKAQVRVCHTRCDEGVQLPYAAFRASLFPLLADLPSEGEGDTADDPVLQALLQGTTGTDTLPNLAIDDPAAVANQQAQLHFSLSERILRLARSAPLLLVVDDLGWADASSFELVQRLVTRLAATQLEDPVPLLILLASRPELARPRRVALERMMREEISSTVELSGMNPAETAELLRQTGLGGLSGQVVEQVRRTTSGNPLFLETAARRIVARQRADSVGRIEAGAMAFSDLELPSELKEAVAQQLDQLSSATRDVLRHAAVIGGAVSLRHLARLHGSSSESLDEAVEEALQHAVIEIDGDTIAFRHDVYRTFLYQGASPARRHRLHAEVARLFTEERRSGLIEAAALADQLIAAGPEASPREVARVCLSAARSASLVYAWVEAARFYKAGLEALDRSPAESADAELATHLHDAGIACDRSLDPNSAAEFLGRATALFQAFEDRRGVVRSAIALARCVIAQRSHEETNESWSERVSTLMRAIDDLDEEDGDLISNALAAVSMLHYSRGEFDQATEIAERAIHAAAEAGSALGRVRASIAYSLPAMFRAELHDCLAHLEEARRIARGQGEKSLICEASNRQPLVRLWLGQLREAEDRGLEAVALSQEINDPVRMIVPLAGLAVAAVGRGDVSAAEEFAYQATLMQRFTSYSWVSGVFHPALASLQMRRGAFDDAERTLAINSDEQGDSWNLPPIARWYSDIYLRAKAGDLEWVRGELAEYPKRLDVKPIAFLGPAGFSCVLIELAELLEMPQLAEAPLRVLEEASERGQVFTSNLFFHIPRMLGKGALLLGDRALAVERLETAVEDTGRIGARCDRALAQLDLARAMDVEQATAAAGLAQAARDEIAALGLAAELEVAEALSARLTKAVADSELPALPPRSMEGALTIMFTDIVGSTELVDRLGDFRAREVIGEHNQIVRKQLVKCGGYEVEQQGDAFMVEFAGARNAVRAAIGIQRDLAALGPGDEGERIRVRIGMHRGDAIRDGSKLFGISVFLAARIAAHANPGQILISSTVHEVARNADDFRVGPEQRVELRGIRGPQNLFEVDWRD